MMDLSVIIPAHNEADRIEWTLDKTIFHLQDLGANMQAEILVIENGSTDETAEIVEHKQVSCPWVRLLRMARADKGLAVRAGMLAARGDLRYMADADLATDIQHIWDFLRIANKGHQIVIGHRDPIINQTKHRAVMSKVFHWCSSLLLPDIHDTQAGYKLFTAEAARAVFNRAQIYGWAFDVEILYIAKQLGLSIAEVKIPWINRSGSKVKPMDSVYMLRDLIRIWGCHELAA